MGTDSKICPNCKEKNNPSFSECWKCGASFDGTPSKESSTKKKSFRDDPSIAWVCLGLAVFLSMSPGSTELLGRDAHRVVDAFSSVLKLKATTFGLLMSIALNPLTLFSLYLFNYQKRMKVFWTITAIVFVPMFLLILTRFID